MPIPLPVIADTYRCALEWSDAASGQHAVNVIHIKANASGTTAADAAAVLSASWVANMFQGSVQTAFVGTFHITPLDGVSASQDFVPTGLGLSHWTGQQSGDFIPQSSIIIKEGTGVRGRQNRGRIFLPFVAESVVAAGTVSGALVGTMTTAWVDFVLALTTHSPINWDLGIASYDRAHSGAGAHFTGLNSISVEGKTGTQRGRMERLR